MKGSLFHPPALFKSAALVGLLGLVGLVTVGASASCTDAFPTVRGNERLLVSVKSGNVGAPDARLPLSFSEPAIVTVRVEAQRSDGSLDTGFDGYVRITSKPGSVVSVRGPGASGRSVKLAAGVADDVEVTLLAAYGDTRLWAEDAGYVPIDPTRQPPPQCSDGLDNDNDGNFDFPLDPGCAFANDDTEGGGTFATGTSSPLYFVRPRISDVRGGANGGAATPFRSEQVSVDTGWNPRTKQFDFDTVVTRISSNGFYTSDLGDPRGFTSIFSFTFSSPQGLRVCDRLRSFTGTATEFFGMTQLASPTWTVEFWNPNKRPCLVPEPYGLKVAELSDTRTLFQHEAGLVRLETTDTVKLRIGAHIGPKVPEPDLIPTDDASNCDIDRNGRVDFTPGSREAACAANCNSDPDCSEYSNFVAQSNFNLVAVDTATNQTSKIQANGSTSPGFDPVLRRGAPLRSFTGTLEYFSGGSQFTIEARCDDDIVVNLEGAPLPSDRACVRPRTELDNNEASQ